MIDSDVIAMGMDFVLAMDLAAPAADAMANEQFADDDDVRIDYDWIFVAPDTLYQLMVVPNEGIDLRLVCSVDRMLFPLLKRVALIYG